MNKRIDFTKLGGLETYQDTLDFLQSSYRGAIGALVAALGDKLVINGLDETPTTIADGWVIIGGELLPFVGGAKGPQVLVDEIVQTEAFEDGTVQPVYYTKRAKLGVTGGFPFTDLRRFKTDGLNVADGDVLASAKAVKQLQDNLLSILSFETTIVLKGCAVSNVAGSNVNIAAGVVLIDNNIVTTPAYAGAFPVFLKGDGTFVAVQPAGSYIKFDPYTSQRYADVLKRATTSLGEIKTFKTLSDRWDNNGLGKWEMSGFKICDDVQSRVLLGYDRRQSDPGDAAWDAAHTVAGNIGGEKTHALNESELPQIDLSGGGVFGRTKKTTPGQATTASGFDATGAGQEPDIKNFYALPTIGGGLGHENRQPFKVVVFAERI